MNRLHTFAFLHPLTEAQRARFRDALPHAEFLDAAGGWPAGIERAQAAALHWDAKDRIDALLQRAAGLQWLHLRSAGIDDLRSPRLLQGGLVLTNGSGNHAPNIAEHVLAMMLAFARQLPYFIRAQDRASWAPAPRQRIFELGGQHLAVVGLGAIGTELARRAHALGLRVTGVRRSAGGEVPAGVERVVTLDALDEVLAQADHVALALPLTPATRQLMDARRLARLKPGACVYNVGRGALLDQDALVRLLQSGHIAGAGLDVTDPEPLPADSPLWTLPNAIVTAHSAGATPRSYERFEALLLDNLRRFDQGRPLLNVVDPAAGY